MMEVLIRIAIWYLIIRYLILPILFWLGLLVIALVYGIIAFFGKM